MKKAQVNIRKIIREELARGMPEFVMDKIAQDAAEAAKVHFVKYARENGKNDPQSQKEMLVKANATVKKLEEELREVLKKHAIAYIYSTN